MTEITLQFIGERLAAIQGEQSAARIELKNAIDAVKDDMNVLTAIVLRLENSVTRAKCRNGGSIMTDLTLEALRIELAPLSAQIDSLQARLDGLPLIGRAITALQQDTRGLRAAFNDFARTNVTAGEVEALHTDVNRAQADNIALEHRIATLERLVASLAEGQQRKG